MEIEEKEKQEWLNLRDGAESKKVYSCNFCRRKFLNSQALGGHQNAHRRERGLLRHFTLSRSLGVLAHAHIHKSAGGGFSSSSTTTIFGLAWDQPSAAAAAADVMWPGSFRFRLSHDQQLREETSSSSNPDMLDLNLKL